MSGQLGKMKKVVVISAHHRNPLDDKIKIVAKKEAEKEIRVAPKQSSDEKKEQGPKPTYQKFKSALMERDAIEAKRFVASLIKPVSVDLQDDATKDASETNNNKRDFGYAAASDDGVDAFDFATLDRNRFPRIAQFVADKSSLVSTPLHVVSAKGTWRCVTALAFAGADINARSRSGTTPLQHAVRASNKQALLSLLSLSADVNVLDNDGNTLCHLAVCHNALVCLGVVLSVAPSLARVRNKWGFTAIEQAAQRGQFDAVRLITVATSDLGVGSATAAEIAAESLAKQSFVVAPVYVTNTESGNYQRNYQPVCLAGLTDSANETATTIRRITTVLTSREVDGLRSLEAFQAKMAATTTAVAAPAVSVHQKPSWFARVAALLAETREMIAEEKQNLANNWNWPANN
jgi:hypothetical protein